MSIQLQLNANPFNSKIDQFRICKLKVLSYLDSLGFSDELTGIKVAETDTEIERSKKLKSFLILSNDNETLSLLSSVEKLSANELWKQLFEHHERDSTMSRLQLKSMLLTEKLKSSERINEFISRIIKISEQMKLTGKAAEDEDLLLCLLRGISSNPEYEMISEILKNQDELTFIKACHRVQDREVEKNKFSQNKSERVNFVNKLNKNKFNEKNNFNKNQKRNIAIIARRKVIYMMTVIED